MESLAEASEFIRVIENRQGIKISAPEEIAYKNGWIDDTVLKISAEKYGKSSYGRHLMQVVQNKIFY